MFLCHFYTILSIRSWFLCPFRIKHFLLIIRKLFLSWWHTKTTQSFCRLYIHALCHAYPMFNGLWQLFEMAWNVLSRSTLISITISLRESRICSCLKNIWFCIITEKKSGNLCCECAHFSTMPTHKKKHIFFYLFESEWMKMLC